MKYVLYDMDCRFCSTLVKKISTLIKSQEKIKFCSFKSSTGQKLLHTFNIRNTNSVAYIDNKKKVFFKSHAVLKICRLMRFPYSLFYFFSLFPTSMLDFLYDYVAKKRYCLI